MKCSVVQFGTGSLFGVPTIEAPLNVPARDIPYYVEVKVLSDKLTVQVNLGFAGLNEELCDFPKGRCILRFGQKTGRIYAMFISDCDTSHPWSEHFRSIGKDISGSQRNRFSQNLVYGLLLAEKIISMLWKELAQNQKENVFKSDAFEVILPTTE